jgi:hypothetical protein
VLVEPVILDLTFQRRPQLSLARDHEARVRDLLNDERRGFDQVALPLVRDERRHIADERRLVRQPELFVQSCRRRGVDAAEVDPLVYGHRTRLRDAVCDEHAADGV